MSSSTLPPPKISLGALSKLAGPIFVSNIAIIGSGTIDTIMAGNLGRNDLAAVALGIAATISVLMGLVGTLQGLSPICGHHYGARQYHLIGQELNQGMWVVLLLTLIGFPILSMTDFWIGLANPAPEVGAMAAQYMFWTALSLPGSLAARTFISINAAVSRPHVAMWISLGMLALKAPLNYVFMYSMGLGGGGAGISFFVLTYLSLLCYVIIWKLDPFYKPLHADHIRGPRWLMIKEQLRVGVPMGMCTFFEVSSFTFMQIFVSRFGATTASAHQIVSNITSLCYMIPFSIGVATSILVSQTLGARWPSLSFYVLKRSLKITCTIALLSSIILIFARGSILWIYTKDAAVHALAMHIIIFGCIYHVFDAMQTTSSFALRGFRVTTVPMIIYGVMLWGLGLGLGYYLSFSGEIFGGPYGVYGFWGATALGLFFTGISLAAMALWVGRQHAKDDTHSAQEIQAAIEGRA